MLGVINGMISPWYKEEDDQLRELYPSTPWFILFQKFPGRTLSSLNHRASRLGLKRLFNEWSDVAKAKQRARNLATPPRLGTGAKVTIVNGQEGKTCTTCSAWFPLSSFSLHATCTGGRRNICRTCDVKNVTEWNRANPEKVVIAARKWQKKNPEKFKLIKHAADNRRHGRMVEGKVTTKELRNRWNEFNYRCGYCLAPADTKDHMVPISRGGKHEIDNIIPACRSCNFKKHTKNLIEFLSLEV